MAGATIIVGASHAGVQAAASLRDAGYDGRIVLVSDEPHLPYHRPPLSKSLLGEAGPKAQPLRPAQFFEQKDIEFTPATRVAAIDLASRRIETATGARMPYDFLVLATGARPILPPIDGCGLEGVLTLRDLDDAARLGQAMQGARDVVVIGAGMIGLEFAAVAAKAGRAVTVIEAGPRVLGRAVSADTAEHLAQEHRRRGVRIVTGDSVSAIRGAGRVRDVETRGGLRMPADLVVVAVGVTPNVELAVAAGLPGAAGIEVDECLATAAPGVFAIGDCALHPNPHAAASLRIESVQNATDQGRAVAAAITGTRSAYAAVPWFWSDQYDLKLQIAGITAGHDLAAPRLDAASGRLSVLCFRQGRLVGVETVNNARDHMAARRLIGSGLQITPAQAADPEFALGAAATQPAAAE